MKQRKKMRLLSVLLSLVLVVGLLPGLAMQADADGTFTFNYAYDCQRSLEFPKKTGAFYVYDLQNPYGPNGSLLSSESIQNKTWTLTYMGNFGKIPSPGTNLTYIAERVAGEYGVDKSSIEIYQLTMLGIDSNGTPTSTPIAWGAIVAHEVDSKAVFIGDSLGPNRGGAGYVLSVNNLSGTVNFTDFQDATAYAHTHAWQATTPGNDPLVAETTIKCNGCDAAMDVSLRAKNVTLPGNVFCAQISSTPNALATGQLDVSNTPGYKYSADGSNFEDIPQGFTPKPGIYQASILVTDPNAQNAQDARVAELFVKYTVSDPAVTAATGDNRPIELMLVGLTAFATMAAVAFLLDSRRRARF